MKRIGLAVLVAVTACNDGEPIQLPPMPAPPAAPTIAPPPAPVAPPKLTFAVISDLHTPNNGRGDRATAYLVTALVAAAPRFVVITGDFTNGASTDGPHRERSARLWYRALREQLAPLTSAGIPIFPVAGNHDSYHDGHRRQYADAWRDLTALAEPYTVHSRTLADGEAYRIDAAPFSYSVDVDGVHLALAHVVDQSLKPEIERWLEADLAAARGARTTLVFGHVPAISIMAYPAMSFARRFAGVLARGGADAYIAGHEHLVWDESYDFGGGVHLRQILIGCGSGSYVFPPSGGAARRADCKGQIPFLTCALPETGARFSLRPHHRGLVQRHRQTFTLIDVEPDGRIVARPYAIDAQGHVVDWADPPERVAAARRRHAAQR